MARAVSLRALLQDATSGEDGAERAARQVQEDAYGGASALLDASRQHGDLAFRAEWVSDSLDESLIPPLVALGPPAEADDRAEYIERLSRLELGARMSLSARLDAMLEDRRPAPAAPGDAPARVCDHAYLAALRMAPRARPAWKKEHDFLARPEIVRDHDIGHLREQDAWRHIVERATLPAALAAPAGEVAVGTERKSGAAYRAALPAATETELAARLATDTLAVPRALVSMTRTDPATAAPAWTVLERLGGLAFRPLLEAGPPPGAEACPRYVDALVSAARALRTEASSALVKLLEDKRDLPPPRRSLDVRPEESHVPRRVCDQAYLALSRLAHFADPEAESDIEQRFLRCSAPVKDAVIARGKATDHWDGPTEGEWRKELQMKHDEAERQSLVEQR